jgi:hypothetical protein
MRPLMIEIQALKHCSVAEHHNAVRLVTMPKAQYDSGRIEKKSWF